MDDCMRVANSAQFYARFHLTQLGRKTKCCAQYQAEQVVRIEKDSDRRKSTLQNMVGGSVILDESAPLAESAPCRALHNTGMGRFCFEQLGAGVLPRSLAIAFSCEGKPNPTMLGAAMRSRRQSSSGYAITNLSG
jgi:hypothetical protein